MMGTLDLFTAGAALIALWLIGRFPSAGPRSIVSSLLLMVVAAAGLSLMTSAARTVVAAVGTPGTLLLDVLPPLTFAFWAWACFVRALLAAIAPFRR
jgi:hypothetical protein